MKVRDQYLDNAKPLTDSGGYTVDLPKNAKIQDIRLVFGATNGATSNTVGKLCGLVSKIEVVDGSDVLHSLSMRQEQANFFFMNGRLPFKYLTGAAAGAVIEEAPISFGRYFRDPLYFLDTSQFKNPQLRVTYAFTVSATAGIATGTGTLSAIARIIEDQAPPYQGFMMSKEIKSWATATSGDEPTQLALNYRYHSLLIAALKTTVDPTTLITNLKLARNSDQFIDFNMSGVHKAQENIQRFGLGRETFRPLVDTSATFLCDFYYKAGGCPNLADPTSLARLTAASGESLTITMVTGGTAGGVELEVKGAMPHASWYHVFGDGLRSEDFLDPSGLSELKLTLTQAVGAAAGTIVTNQIRQ